ncbi:hypothetical protein RU080_00460 [Shewanella algae]|uniref:hypothetical protein n=1 Tax=Shewanella algae TaxID=38313 RepID=UPI002935EA9C|nr:hypothetical protein [Shewanella algae]MDV2960218.1 hypothetical protein [Shewanella algae]
MSFHQLIYLDKEFISDLYEESTGKSPSVNITKAEGANAGIKAMFLSAGVSSTESKTYTISTSKMLTELKSELAAYDELDYKIDKQLAFNSKYFWVKGSMSVQKTTVTRQKQNVKIDSSGMKKENVGEPEIKGEEKYFSIKDNNENTFPLIATSEYFTSSLLDLINLTGTVVEAINFEVDALIRVLPARTSFNGWVAIPLIIRESGS